MLVSSELPWSERLCNGTMAATTFFFETKKIRTPQPVWSQLQKKQAIVDS
jgi:hypothetical protein